MVDKRRRSDPDDNQDYKNRTFVDLRSVLLIVAALSGGSLTDLGLTYFKDTPPVVEMQLQRAVNGIDRNREYIDSYIKSQEAIDAQKTITINNSLNEIKEDVSDLKEDLKRIERLIRSQNPQ